MGLDLPIGASVSLKSLCDAGSYMQARSFGPAYTRKSGDQFFAASTAPLGCHATIYLSQYLTKTVTEITVKCTFAILSIT